MSETENDQRVDSTDKAMGPSESLHDIPMTPERKSSASTNTKTEGAEPTAQEEGLEHEVIPELESPELEIGDHVYQWRSLCGVPYMFQHHGIVMDVIKDEEGNPVRLTIADFSNVEAKGTEKAKCLKGMENNSVTTKDSPTESAPKPENEPSEDQPESVELEPPKTSQKRRSSLMFSSRQMSLDQITLEQEGLVRTYTDTDKWHKVRYQSGFWKRQLNRSGTVTGARSDPVGLVLARVNFIMQHPEKLPDYHVLHANCECVAFWCKTGNWSTLQASSFLELTAAGYVASLERCCTVLYVLNLYLTGIVVRPFVLIFFSCL